MTQRLGERPLLAVVPPSLFAFALGVFQLSRPNVLTGYVSYDDGVYFGAAVRLVHGALPYRDFVFVHPPGIALLFAPLAFLADAIGTHDGLVLARALTGAVAIVDVVLVGVAVRARGPLAVLLASSVLAFFPFCVAADSTALLEPYLVLGCLVGVLSVFPRGDLAGGTRLLLGGVAFGCAGGVKVWAVLPAAAVLVAVAPRWRAAARFSSGVAVGFLVVCVPFAALAPASFWREVVVSQLTRHAGGAGVTTLAQRVLDLSGIPVFSSLAEDTALAVAVAVAVAAIVVSGLVIGRHSLTAFDRFTVCAALCCVAAVLVSREFYIYYSYFPIVFVALALSCSISRVLGRDERLTPSGRRVRTRSGDLARVATALVVVAVAAGLAGPDLAYASSYVEGSYPSQPGPTIDAAIPAGSCVVFDSPALALIANRFVASDACPPVVDPYGLWITDEPTTPPPYAGPFAASLTSAWQGYFAAADDVVLSVPRSDFIPWDAALDAQFDREFSLVAHTGHAWIYRRVAASAP